ncbi:uncharacterized protein K444DRAFT_408682 [Hyaloscypha bicolor E]|uniref:Uncharacterized protein n=1 Tax=Hyaloscypha bicolor E TaxID=1095630 RepID=A0A2J6T9L9_9HELO|nr:uncharacterized protein K444DRAFT_408682 [Hyaloscypha bicolor E]PMD59727.1 hypothetical protein K444DRAFT_408682 [Hyaloscypha bicolor E]
MSDQLTSLPTTYSTTHKRWLLYRMKQLASNLTSSTETSTSLSGIFSPLYPPFSQWTKKAALYFQYPESKSDSLTRLGEGRIFHAGNSEIAEEGDLWFQEEPGQRRKREICSATDRLSESQVSGSARISFAIFYIALMEPFSFYASFSRVVREKKLHPKRLELSLRGKLTSLAMPRPSTAESSAPDHT